MMEELKKAIIDNLYKSNFYEALINIQKLETSFPDAQETLFLYYYSTFAHRFQRLIHL